MSTRAIGSAIGVDQKTVVNDRKSGGENSPPEVDVITDAATGEQVFEIEWADDLNDAGFVLPIPDDASALDDEPALTQEECEALDAEHPS